ncbi:MAG TPA: TonB-dependent receptor [Allosphingosinicella sp.]|nr:TonB-dependent receptor [Allosphingosinicella sp.]
MKRSVRASILAWTAIGALSAGSAHAQSTAAEPGEASTDAQVEDIIVTAQKRSERLQDVPIAVTTVKGEQLSAMGVESAIDLRLAAPSLNSTNANGYLASSIRGVGSLNFAATAESPVGLYIDGVYLGAAQASELTLNNIQSVEVLKGPQGTLFGRNSTGGVVQITTVTPSDVPTGRFSVGYANYDTLTGNAYISGGLADGLAADFAFAGRTQGKGWGKNIITGSDVNRTKHDLSFRSKLVWEPGPETKVTLIGNYWDGNDTQGTIMAYPGKLSGPVPGRVNPDLGYNSDSDHDYFRSGWSYGGTLKIDHNFDSIRIASISAYRKGRSFLSEDLDFTPFDVMSLKIWQETEQFSQELQLSSRGSSRLTWTGGLYYFYLKGAYPPIILDLLNVPGAGIILTQYDTLTAKSGAAYGQATYEILDDTHLTVGGRYTTERRADIDASQIVEIPFLGLTIPTAFPDRRVTANKFTYRISLDHRFSDEVLVYASLNTGFKSGGYNPNAHDQLPYRPETVTAYEAGLKTDLFDRRLRFNVAGFYYDYKDIQVERLTATALVVENGPSARIYGADVDFTAVLGRGFNLTGGINWISPKFRKYPDCSRSTPAGGQPLTIGPCDGNQIPFAAKFTASAAANYSADLGSGKLLATANVYYNSGYAFQSDNILKQRRYAKLGASAKWTSDRGMSVGVFGRNLTNRRTAAFGSTQSDGNVVVSYAEPRTYGITLGYEF